MKKCPYCSSIHSDSANFCTSCGGEMDDTSILNFGKKESEYAFFVEEFPNRRDYLLCLGLYFAFFYIISSILSIIIGYIWTLVNGGANLFIPSIKAKFNRDVLAWTNFFTYSIALLVLVPKLFSVLKYDIKVARKNLKFYLNWTGIGIGIMYGATIIGNLLVTLFSFGLDTGVSENQNVINTILANGGVNTVLVAILTVIFAPILEELIFRKSLFGLFKKNTIKTVIISAIIFASIHVVPACISLFVQALNDPKLWTDFYLEFIYIFAYLGQGFAMSYVYYKTNGNIVPSILIHFFNNLIALLVNMYVF